MGERIRGYHARLCWNDKNWVAPAGEARLAESDSYAAEYGYGMEEWLFDISRTIDGWHYGYVRAIEHSRNRLLRDGERSLRMLLWTKDPQRRRWYVGEIRRVEVLTGDDSAKALQEYDTRGWLDEMIDQLAAVDLEPPAWEEWIFNCRFKPDDVILFDPPRPVLATDRIHRSGRYQLVAATSEHASQWERRAPLRAKKLEGTIPRMRIAPTVMTLAHNQLQNHLVSVLVNHYGKRAVKPEQNYVDIECTVGKQVHLIELKSNPSPKGAIREAIGQLLEYAYFSAPDRQQPCLHVVAPGPANDEVRAYIQLLNDRFSLKIQYHSFTRGSTALKLS